MALIFQNGAAYLQSIQCDWTRGHCWPMKSTANTGMFDFLHYSMACTRKSGSSLATLFACTGTNSSLDSVDLHQLQMNEIQKLTSNCNHNRVLNAFSRTKTYSCSWPHHRWHSNPLCHHIFWIVEDKCYRIKSSRLHKLDLPFYCC